MRVVSWNVNSVRARLARIEPWLKDWSPDLLCMQEIKVVDDDFPREIFEQAGYHLETFGQKTYNGVAIATRKPLENVFRGLPDDADDAPRRVIGGRCGQLNIINVYAPNGTELDSAPFAYKLEWFRRLRTFLNTNYQPSDQLMIIGDINIAPEDRDVYDADHWRDRLLFTDEEHAALRHVLDWGLIDGYRTIHKGEGLYSWWDYRSGMYQQGKGVRIDLALMSKPLEERVETIVIDRQAREGEKPSDHAPLIVDLVDEV
jgi:exodeoxyribonuclease III